MKKLLLSIPLLVGCSTITTSYYQSNSSIGVVDSVNTIDKLGIISYKDWAYSAYLDGKDSNMIKVYYNTIHKSNKTYIMSVTTNDTSVIKSNVRINVKK